ncbi:MAG: sulfatase-like hydrolase/transferase [Thermomicrobiales bacterium]
MLNARAISTRERIRLLGGLAGATVGAGSAALPAREADAAGLPDIIVLVLNDARDGDQVAMPQTMAKFGADGTTFRNFFMTTSLCCPARATILTGLYPHHHGVYDNSDGKHGGWQGFVKNGNRSRSTGPLLQAAGYRTVGLGTYLNGARPGKGPEPGWNVAIMAQEKAAGKGKKGKKGKGKKKKSSGKTRMIGALGDDQMIATVAAELAATPVSQPLYFHVGFNTPHFPAIPGPAYAGRFAGAQVARDASFNEADVSDKPAYVRKLGGLKPGHEAWLDALHQRRLECMAALDDALNMLWPAILARGKADNTYVFLFTDNGHLMGQHRLYGKIAPYDSSSRFPLYALGPGFTPATVDDRLVNNADIAPTLVAVSGAAGGGMDGVSLLSAHNRSGALLESLSKSVDSMNWPGPRTSITPYRAVRTAQHLYVEYRGSGRELYDYAADPYELQNLLAHGGDATAAALGAQLSGLLQSLG